MTLKEQALIQNRKLVLVELITEQDIPDTVVCLISILTEKINSVPKEYRDKVIFEIHSSTTYDLYMNVYYHRPETDEEFMIRIRE